MGRGGGLPKYQNIAVDEHEGPSRQVSNRIEIGSHTYSDEVNSSKKSKTTSYEQQQSASCDPDNSKYSSSASSGKPTIFCDTQRQTGYSITDIKNHNHLVGKEGKLERSLLLAREH